MSIESMQQRIAKGQDQISKNRAAVRQGKMRQHYHFMPECGWMNDPNGLIYFKGKYHFFYQCNPYGNFWDCMHWGHAVSEDLLHWEYLPLALAPSEPYDDFQKGGCFSGSAIEKDGVLYLFYTGAINEGNGFYQHQCLARSEDGVHFEKYEGNPVVTVPDGFSAEYFRDPKVWEHEGCYYMVVGAGLNGHGMALLFRSEDLLHWDYINVLAESRGEWGYMWECPDFFELDGRYVLTCSPMGSGDHTAIYMTGNFDYATGRFECISSGEMDWGFDFYAPQSFLAPDGRRITVGWANEWEWMPLWKDWGPTYKEGWCGSFNIPRELFLSREGQLCTRPIREIETLRKDPFFQAELTVQEEEMELSAGNGCSCELKFEVDLKETDARRIDLLLRADEKHETRLTFDLEHGAMCVDRNRSDDWSRGISRSVLNLGGKEKLDVHILIDQSSIEVFADGYRNNHSNNVFAADGQTQIRLRAEGGKAVLRHYEAYRLEECYK